MFDLNLSIRVLTERCSGRDRLKSLNFPTFRPRGQCFSTISVFLFLCIHLTFSGHFFKIRVVTVGGESRKRYFRFPRRVSSRTSVNGRRTYRRPYIIRTPCARGAASAVVFFSGSRSFPRTSPYSLIDTGHTSFTFASRNIARYIFVKNKYKCVFSPRWSRGRPAGPGVRVYM